jgi:hypothetical protein
MKKRRACLKIKLHHITVSVLPLPARLDDGDTLGYWSSKDQAIYIHPDHPPSEQARILWHEIVHGFYWVYNWDDAPLKEEAICDRLESPLTALFNDNPHLAAALAAAAAGAPLV